MSDDEPNSDGSSSGTESTLGDTYPEQHLETESGKICQMCFRLWGELVRKRTEGGIVCKGCSYVGPKKNPDEFKAYSPRISSCGETRSPIMGFRGGGGGGEAALEPTLESPRN